MIIRKTAIAGTLESSDIMVTLEAGDGNGIYIQLDSTVEKQFGDAIRAVISGTLAELGVADARVIAIDKGALDCTIRARVKTAAMRATEKRFCWEGIEE